jgi:hypothetical protein
MFPFLPVGERGFRREGVKINKKMYNEQVIYYSKNPFNKFVMKDFSVSHFEENELC